MTTVLIVDDHVAVRAGLRSVLRLGKTFAVVAAVGDATAALGEARRTPIDVAVVDYQLGGTDGLTLCRALKRVRPSTATVIYTAYDPRGFTVAGAVAGVDGVIGKGAPAEEVLAALEAVIGGDKLLPELSPDAMRDSARRLEPEELPILGMRVNGTPEPEIADALDIEPGDVRTRIDAMLDRLRPPTRGDAPPNRYGSSWPQMQGFPHIGDGPPR
jgi:DNA-binding NarL/FixJ family response regulator